MANYLNPFSGRQFIDASGTPYSGAKLFIYQAGTSTKITTYKDSAGASSHTNPIVLNSKGEPADGAGASQPIWQSSLYAAKLVLAPANDTDPPASAISTWDNISGINNIGDLIDQRSDTGAVEFTLHEYFEDRTILAKTFFGLTLDGVADDTAELQAALTACSTRGGGVVELSPGTCLISSTITIPNNVRLIGSGGDKNHDVGTNGGKAATKINWNGAAGGTMFSMSSTSGASNQSDFGHGLSHMYINANGAAIGVQLRSVVGATFENLFGREFSTAFFDLGVVSTLGESESTQHCLFRGVWSRNTSSVPDGGLFILDGDYTTTANTSYNTFINCWAQTYNGTGYSLNNCDNNLFIGCRATETGTGAGIVFEGSNANAADVARNNIFFQYGNASITAKGTATYTHPSYDNRVICIDNDNGTPVPTVEAGATLRWDQTSGIYGGGHAFVQLAIGDSTTNADSGRDNQGTISLVIRNNGENHEQIMKGDGTLVWKRYVETATGDLHINGQTSTGDFEVDLQAAKHIDMVGGAGYAVNGTKVIGARETGWTAGTGTANKAAFATYAGQNVSAGYVEAEAQATDDAAKANSQRIKAIEDALRTHGLIN